MSRAMSSAIARWFSNEITNEFFNDRVLAVDDDAARALSASTGASACVARASRARVTSCALVDAHGDARQNIFDDDDVALTRAYGASARELMRSRARERGNVRVGANDDVVFLGCDGGESDIHATCVREFARRQALNEESERNMSDELDANKEREWEDDDEEEDGWGTWDDDANANANANANASERISNESSGIGAIGARAMKSNEVSVKFFPPLMYRAIGRWAFVISRARVEEARARDAAEGRSSADAELTNMNRVLGHHLAEIAAHWGLVPDYFALGRDAEAVSRVAALAKPEAVGVDAAIKPRSAAFVLIDRSMDLLTPSVSQDGWLERVSSGSVEFAGLSPLLGDEATVALDEALCCKSARDGALYIRKLLREAARVEGIALGDGRDGRVVSADDLTALVCALENDPSVGLRHRALIQRARITAASLTSENDMKANRQIIALQRLTSAAIEGKSTRVGETVVEILKVMYSTGGTAVGNPLEALALVLAAHVLAVEANTCASNVHAGAPPPPFDASMSAALRDAFVNVLAASETSAIVEQLPGFASSAPGALEALETVRCRRKASEARTPIKDVEKSDGADGWDADGWGDAADDADDDGWGESDSPTPSDANVASAEDGDRELADALVVARDVVDAAFTRLAAAALARSALKITPSRSLCANGLPNPALVDIISRVKTNLDDQGIGSDFVHVAGSLGTLLKHAAGAGASIVSGAMGRLGSLIHKVATAPKPSDHDVIVVFLVGSATLGELALARAETAPALDRAFGRRSREFLVGAAALDVPYAHARIIARF